MLRTTQTHPGEIARAFKDPKLELIRLLKEAAEIEHSLLVQYLYAAFSVRIDRYPLIVGFGDRMPGTPSDLLGVAIEEMDHLDHVNKFLVELGAAPNLERQDLPYEHSLYPFPFTLEPLSLQSLARYVYVEASKSAIDPHDPNNADSETRAFLKQLYDVLPENCQPNQLGSLYTTILGYIDELKADQRNSIPNIVDWTFRIKMIRDEGEVEHFKLFQSIFLGNHFGFNGIKSPWELDPSDEKYPARKILINPTAYLAAPNTIRDSSSRQLAWLSNLHYWLVCMFLDLGYRGFEAMHTAARLHMVGPLRQLGFSLAGMGVGMPFDRLSLGYSRGIGTVQMRELIYRFLREAESLESTINGDLPSGYPVAQTISTTRQMLIDLQIQAT